MRIAGKGWAIAAALMAVGVMVQVSLAQPGEGRRGRGPGGGFGGPPTPVRLLGVKEVQDALKLTDEQKTKITDLNNKVREEIRTAMQDGGSREKVQKLMDETTAKVKEILDEGQQKRLLGIFVQVNGANAVANPDVAKELNVTDDQKKKIEEIRQKNMDSMRGLRDQSGDREAMREKMTKLRDEESKAIFAVLTEPQQKQLEELKGEKVNVDLSQLRGPGGPGGGRNADRPRGNRNRNANSENKSN